MRTHAWFHLLGVAAFLTAAGCSDSSPTDGGGTPKLPDTSDLRHPAGKGAGSRAEAAPTPEEVAAARAIAERAVTAHAGSPERLGKLRVYTSLSKGAMYSALGNLPARREIAALWPDRFRL